MTIFIQNFVIALPVFILLDFIWLGMIMNKFYLSQFGSLARRVGDSFKPNWIATIITYLILAFGLVMLVTTRAYGNDSLGQAVVMGAIFGLVVYGVYDLTNLAVLHGWSLRLTIIDMLWGIFVSATVSGVTVTLAKLFFR